MNAAQSRALVALWDRIAELRGKPADELHLGSSREVVKIEVRPDDEMPDENWQSVTVWTGGTGACLLLDGDGKLYGDFGDDEPVPAVLTVADDGRIGWTEAGQS